MSSKAHGQIRRSQVITTWGPGALLDLPHHSAIVGGLEFWSASEPEEEILEPRLVRKLQYMTGIQAPRLYAPPPDPTNPWETKRGIKLWRFPEWFVVQEEEQTEGFERSRRLVHRRQLDDRKRFEGLRVVATRFVRGCPRGHVDDIRWRAFVHPPDERCRRQLWLDEKGTSGDLGDLEVRCECGAHQPLLAATDLANRPLGTCSGDRPWLGLDANEECKLPSRLLTRTASNAYFAQVMSVLSLPDRVSDVESVVRELWDLLSIVKTRDQLTFVRDYPDIAAKLASFSDEEVLEAIRHVRDGAEEDRPVKQVELEAILAAPEGYGDDVPVNPDFHARRLPEDAWRSSRTSAGIVRVIQLHRLREVLALAGFTRFEAEMPDIQGEYEGDVERAALAREPTWFPAVENRGEGLFLQLEAGTVDSWLERPPVRERLDNLLAGHKRWAKDRKLQPSHPGGPYVLLHTLSHLLIQSLAMRCGYPASSIRERIYADSEVRGYGILLYTASPDAEGTLGGLVQQARHVEDHLEQALRTGALCSNDPICAQHDPGTSIEGRWLHGAACHGCALVAETSCEMRNDHLDRALVVPILGVASETAFFKGVA